MSTALPFAMFPLAHISSDRKKMRDHVNSWPVSVVAYVIAVALTALIIFSFVADN